MFGVGSSALWLPGDSARLYRPLSIISLSSSLLPTHATQSTALGGLTLKVISREPDASGGTVGGHFWSPHPPAHLSPHSDPKPGFDTATPLRWSPRGGTLFSRQVALWAGGQPTSGSWRPAPPTPPPLPLLLRLGSHVQPLSGPGARGRWSP